MAQIVEQSGGDPDKMQEILDRAKKDPKAFYDSLKADQEKSYSRRSGPSSKSKCSRKTLNGALVSFP